MPTRVILITGSARRIGAEIANTLHQAGMNLILHYHESQGPVNQLSETFNNKRKDSAFTIQADLRIIANLANLIQSATQHFGRLDGIINNASIFYPTPLSTLSEEKWHDIITTNLMAPFFLSQAGIEPLRQTKGSIINITDQYADRPLKNYSIYSISKAALKMMTLTLAKELAPDIRVNAVAPGNILWPEGNSALDPKTKESLIKKICLNRIGSPSDIAQAVLYLLDAEYVTGETIHVDGGRSFST